jgi:two-component system sensor kinase FixL
MAYVVAAVLLDRVSDIGLYSGLGVTPWNPTSGLSLAFAFVFGRSSFPFLFSGQLISALLVNPVDFPLVWIVVIAAAAAAIWLGAAEMLRRLPDFDPRLGTVPAVLCLIGVGLVQSVVQCFSYIGPLWLTGNVEQSAMFAVAWRLVVGHMVGVLVVAPTLLMLHAGWRLPRPTLIRGSQVGVLLIAVWIVFSYRAASAYQLFYLLFLPVLWVALREGVGGAALMLNVAQVCIIIGTNLRTDIVPSSGALQVLTIALALTGLLVGAVVTDRQAAGQRLRDQHAALGRVLRLRSAGETAAAISHQINQPITAISTYASVAREAVRSNDLDLARTALDKLTEECDRAAAVARSIRDLVKQGSLAPAPVKLTEVIEALRKSHEAEARALDIALDIEIAGSLPTLMADRIQLEQAIDNLVTNSIEAINEAGRGSRILISARVENGDVHIEVSDDGPGFAPGLEAIATTPFMTTKRNGSGLGLAIARSVAEAHGGSLAVVHRSSGACVRLRLPTAGNYHDQGHQHH